MRTQKSWLLFSKVELFGAGTRDRNFFATLARLKQAGVKVVSGPRNADGLP